MARPAVTLAPAAAAAEAARAGEGYWQIAWRRLRRHRLAMGGLAVIALLILAAVFAPWIAPYRFEQIDLTNRFAPPFVGRHWLGTDDLGHDVFTRLLYAGRVSLVVGFAAAFSAVALGTLVGVVAGYYGGLLDNVLMRLTDIVLTLPVFGVLLLLGRYFGGGILPIVVIIGLFGWTVAARLVRGEILRLKTQDFADAARALGASETRIIFRHLLPNAMAPIIVAATLDVGGAILTEAALSYFGVGIQPPIPSWGNMLQNAQSYLWTDPWLAFWPGLMIFLTVLCFNFFGDGLRDALDPRLKI
ncbi:MAG: ABC transporter permease [Armatimonadota bacterium]|nr:ABC transporter permease [Armatimonadota bacterium]MDR7401450.1 ABC transporter permease [Armatimonadota bacterium]MDR7404707.1 ABC transporter permease [Armatimonadota bacterium]MDR7437214.1 ABC transporter permease [Armatimonadota bacterium]MDR7473014.1 ABC transporter permease [Armatimonadota bacterium]